MVRFSEDEKKLMATNYSTSLTKKKRKVLPKLGYLFIQLSSEWLEIQQN